MPKYAMVTVRNPVSMFHSVHLRSGQDFLLTVESDREPNIRIGEGSYIVGTDIKDRGCYWSVSFHVDERVRGWEEYSSCYLGEVNVTYDRLGNDVVARLLVFQVNTNSQKPNYLTVVEPKFAALKVLPCNVLEFVLRGDYGFYGYRWQPAASEYDLNLLRAHFLSLASWRDDEGQQQSFRDHPTLPFARLPRFALSEDLNVCSGQSHFWFYFSDSILDVLKLNQVAYAGSLSFYGGNSKEPDFSVSLSVDLNEKYRERMSMPWLIHYQKPEKPSLKCYDVTIKQANTDTPEFHGCRKITLSSPNHRKLLTALPF